MNQVINYQKELEKKLQQLERENKVPTLLIHSCCAPCSSYVLEYLSQYFYITILYYNPNIYPPTEYEHRVAEQERLIQEMQFKYPVKLIKGTYDPAEFYAVTKGFEQAEEGGERCFRCYELRLKEAAVKAKELGFDYFATTLTISPQKNASKLNEIGNRLGEVYGVSYLASDFKKKEGYKRSITLSNEHNLYRQDYCGCVFSRRER